MRYLLAATLLAFLSLHAAKAQEQGADAKLRDTSCADYLKASAGSGWSDGLTGKTGIDQTSTERASKIHDFCMRNPDRRAGDALAGDASSPNDGKR